MKKYQLLTSDTKTISHPKTKLPIKLYRIIALKTWNRGIIRINEGDIGGYIESEENLSHDDLSWVFHDAVVFDNAKIIDTVVMQRAAVFGSAVIRNSMIQDRTLIYGNCNISDSHITGNSDIFGNTTITFCQVNDSCIISGNAIVESTKMYKGAWISDDAYVTNSKLFDQSRIIGNSRVDNCTLRSSVCVFNQTVSNEDLSRDIVLFQSYPEIQGVI